MIRFFIRFTEKIAVGGDAQQRQGLIAERLCIVTKSELALKLIAENKAKHARGEDARVLDLGN